MMHSRSQIRSKVIPELYEVCREVLNINRVNHPLFLLMAGPLSTVSYLTVDRASLGRAPVL